MKFTVFFDGEREEEVIVYARKNNEIVKSIEKLVTSDNALKGYKDGEIVPLSLSQIESFFVENNKIFAVLKDEEIQIRSRLYIIEEKLPDNFIKINKSCIANLNMVSRFNASISGTLQVKFKSGRIDYVSRRNLKNVKERLGI